MVLHGLSRRVAAGFAIIVPVVASLAFAAPAGADHDRIVISQCGPSHGGGHGVGAPRYRTYEQVERERGLAAGSRAGWREGWEDGYFGRRSDCACSIDLSCESRWFRRGFLEAFERSYNAGYRAGAIQRERERCAPSRYPHRIW